MEIKLDIYEKDALIELFNISVGKTAKLMSEIVNKEILLSVPEIIILPKYEVINLQSINSVKVCSISQFFSSKNTGDGVAFLVFPEHKSSEIVRLMMGNELFENEMTDLEDEAMTEIGNMIINSCLGTIANLTNSDMNFKLPTFFRGEISNLIPSEKFGEKIKTVVVMYINYQISGHDINGYLFFLMELNLVKLLASFILKDAYF